MSAASERYPSPGASQPLSSLAAEVRELRRRVDQLTGARPLQHTALTGGSMRVIDPASSVEAVRVGVVRNESDGDRYGFMLVDEGGIRFEVNAADGFRQPAFPMAPAPQKQLGAGPYVTTTSGTFEGVYRGVATATHKGVTYRFIVVTDASTVGEVRIRHLGTGAASAALTCAAGGQTDGVLQWLHDQPLATGPHQFDLQARRVSGAGSVFVFWPELAAMISGSLCTENGLPPFPTS